MGADDFADAYHGIPNCPTQLRLRVVAILKPDTQRIQFHLRFRHLFGLCAAVVNINKLPELLTAVCRRIGACPTWHLFSDQGCLEFESPLAGSRPAGAQETMGLQDFINTVYELVGRPFKETKRLQAAPEQVHLGLLNDMSKFGEGKLCICPKEGELQGFWIALKTMKEEKDRGVAIGDVLKITRH